MKTDPVAAPTPTATARATASSTPRRVDLNNDDYRRPTASLPVPGQEPYPNPLDAATRTPTTTVTRSTLLEEFELWRYSVTNGASPSVTRLNYSAGLKYSIYVGRQRHQARSRRWRPPATTSRSAFDGMAATTAATSTIDLPHTARASTSSTSTATARSLTRDNASLRPARDEPVRQPRRGSRQLIADGWLSDDERDEDADGLTNWIELHGPMLPTWYGSHVQGREGVPGGLRRRQPDRRRTATATACATAPTTRTTTTSRTIRELSRNMAGPAGGWDCDDDGPRHRAHRRRTPARVDPYNPCLPYADSRTCPDLDPVHGRLGAVRPAPSRTSSSSSTSRATRPRLHGPSRPAAAARGPASGTRRSSAPSA